MKYPFAKKYADIIEEKTHVNVEYFAIGLALVLAALLFSGFKAKMVANSIGFLYPVYATVVAIESTNKEDDTQWLTYWVVFALFSTIENFTSIILYWLPFFYPLKVTVLLWCMSPKYNGATIVYENIIRPHFLKHQSAIDQVLNSAVNSSERRE